MGGKLRPAVIAASALVLLAIASPVALRAGPLAAHDVAAANSDAKHASKGCVRDAKAAPAMSTPAGTSAADSSSPAAAAVPSQPPAPPSVATGPTPASASGTRSLPVQIQLSRPRVNQLSERADHASPGSRGLHAGAGADPDDVARNSPSVTASTMPASSGAPSTGTQAAVAAVAAATAAAAKTSTKHAGGMPAPPPVAVEPPAAPQPNPPLSTQPAPTGARLDWILVGIVVALAAAVVATVRVATLRGRRPPR